MSIVQSQPHDRLVPFRNQTGHTLIEAMFAMSIMVMVVMALMSAHLVGMRQNQLIESKAGASDSSRRTLSKMPEDIRGSKMWLIGNLSSQTFVKITNGLVRGNALQLYQTTNGSSYIRYYFDLTDATNSNGKLLRATDSSLSAPVVMASNLIDTLYFTAEDFAGVTATNTATSKTPYKSVIHTTLQFKQFQYPLTQVGSNCLFDYYRLDYIIAPHLPE